MPDLPQTISTPVGSLNIGSNRIAHALAAATRLDESVLGNARAAVCDYVRLQRAVDTPPEAIIARVKAIALSACSPDMTFDMRQALMTRVVEWSIETYYGRSSPDAAAEGPARLRADA